MIPSGNLSLSEVDADNTPGMPLEKLLLMILAPEPGIGVPPSDCGSDCGGLPPSDLGDGGREEGREEGKEEGREEGKEEGGKEDGANDGDPEGPARVAEAPPAKDN